MQQLPVSVQWVQVTISYWSVRWKPDQRGNMYPMQRSSYFCATVSEQPPNQRQHQFGAFPGINEILLRIKPEFLVALYWIQEELSQESLTCSVWKCLQSQLSINVKYQALRSADKRSEFGRHSTMAQFY